MEKHGLARGERKKSDIRQYVTPQAFKARTRRKEAALRAKVDKIKNSEKLRQVASRLIHDVSPGLVSQEIMEGRLKAEQAEKARKDMGIILLLREIGFWSELS